MKVEMNYCHPHKLTKLEMTIYDHRETCRSAELNTCVIALDLLLTEESTFEDFRNLLYCESHFALFVCTNKLQISIKICVHEK
jgi:hypothetical protein